MRKIPNRILSSFGTILYLIGVAIGLVLLFITVWGDIEASTFDAALHTDEGLSSLKCPVVITSAETGIISVTVENPLEKEIDPVVRARFTMGFVTLMMEDRVKLQIPPGEKETLTWKVTQEDAAYRRLILARVYQFANKSLQARQGACGIVVLPITGLTGQQLMMSAFAASLVAMAAGLWLWISKREDESKYTITLTKGFIFLGTYLLLATLLALGNSFLLGTFLIVFAIISTIAVFSFAAIRT